MQKLWIASVDVLVPQPHLVSSGPEIIQRLKCLELTEITTSEERQQEMYVCQWQNIVVKTSELEFIVTNLRWCNVGANNNSFIVMHETANYNKKLSYCRETPHVLCNCIIGYARLSFYGKQNWHLFIFRISNKFILDIQNNYFRYPCILDIQNDYSGYLE